MITNSIQGAGIFQPQSADTSSNSQPASAGIDTLANEQTFLKLLVAQIRNQDPLQPQDGTQFVAQLAQFSSLEQQIQMRQDLDAINSSLSKPPAQATEQQ
jgi:flagellar basal-body rod modification protein FlgD